MTSTQYSLGIDDYSGSATSIMKPPGGDCHDIFGADFHGTPSHHRVLKPPGGGTSALFATTADETDKGKVSEGNNPQQSDESINGVEGKTNGVNGKTGNDSISDDLDSLKSKDDNSEPVESRSSSMSAEIKSITAQEEKRLKREGNPVTGEGYDTPETPAAPPQRTRIPPGGYSSGLW